MANTKPCSIKLLVKQLRWDYIHDWVKVGICMIG